MIVPDLTAAERKEEAGMLSEVELKNKDITEEDKAKNLEWMVVGKRGERRIIKGRKREDNLRENPRRSGQSGQGRGGAALTQIRRTETLWVPRTGGPAMEDEDQSEMEEEQDSSQQQPRTRINSKRNRTDSDTEPEPPAKH